MSARVSAGANNLARLWTRKVELIGDKAFDADSDLKLAIMDTIYTSSAQFPQPDPPPLHKALRAMMASLERVQFTALPLPVARILTWISPSWRRSYNTISDFLNNKIAEARAREAELAEAKQGEGLATDADCVVDMIAQREAREAADTFDGGELLDELMAYVLAGQDTTAATLLWLFKYLPLDTEIQQRLYDELCTAFGPVSDEEGPLDFNILNDSSKVPVLEAIVAETQRCAMIVPIVGRELVADEIILGQHIPKGGQLMFLLGYMHMQESEWGPDATTWRPARWLRDDGSFNSAAGPTFPFGIGQRACFGQRLAILQLKMFVATLSRVFMFKPLPSDVDNWDAILKITREPKSFQVSLDRRSVD
ncbi:hypothetical protein FRC06_010126 [Ceratobasidium sp. 370]|nr:hypothetical protein FRC06_010126 [Ceratobasidium sp. 370]